MQRGRLVLSGTGAAIVLAIGAGEGCRDATQVILEIDTKLTCNELRGIEIIVGSEPYAVEKRSESRFAAASTSQCAPKPGGGSHVGTLVLTPSGGRGAVLVIAGVTDRASSCLPPFYKGCVVARRSFAFIDHVSLTLPVLLDPVCLDVPCNAVSTCSDKQCVKSEVTCEESRNCATPDLPTPDNVVDAAIPDAPLPGVDGSMSDAGTDAANKEGGVDGGKDATTGPGGHCPSSFSCPSSSGAVSMCKGLVEDRTCCYTGTDDSKCQPRTQACTGLKACCRGKRDCPVAGENCCASSSTAQLGTDVFCGDDVACGANPTYICETPAATSPDCPGLKACVAAFGGPSGFSKCGN